MRASARARARACVNMRAYVLGARVGALLGCIVCSGACVRAERFERVQHDDNTRPHMCAVRRRRTSNLGSFVGERRVGFDDCYAR